MKHSLLALAIMCVTVGPALAQEGSASLNPTGQLLAKGAAARISVSVSCPAGYEGYVFADCNQRTGRRLNNAYGSTNLTCLGGEAQTVEITLRPYNEPLKRGDLFCTAGLSACNADFSDCVDVIDEGVVKLTSGN